jgi:predicted ATPase/DNA-binding XRE family transcriptional regulator
MRRGAPGSFSRRLKALREAAGFTQDELATIAGLSVQAIGALERGERRRPHMETVRSLSAALDLNAGARDALIASARAPAHDAAVDELSGVTLHAALTNLVGRNTDLQTLQQWLGSGARLVTLVGSGGVGKTRLAIEVARRVAENEAVRVVFVELAAIRQPLFVALTVAEALGLPDAAGYDLPRHVRAACSQERPTLLVLDNFEQVLDAAPLVAELVTSASALRILITSRAPLRLRGERLYTVEPLGLQADADANCPADVARAPAVRLFIERVREAQPDFRVTPANARTLTAICRRLDALPLALELAAPWMKVLTPEDLLHRLERSPILPEVGTRDLPERQQTMNAAVAWSYHLLSASEQCAFRRFSVLPGLFPINAASAVLGCASATTDDGNALRAVGGLIDKSLLVRVHPSVTSTRPMYQMLETVRAYAALQLESSGERDNAFDGLVNYCTSEASRAASGLVGPAQAEWLHRVNEDLDSYRGALTWLIDHDREAEAIHIAWSLLFFWFIRGRAAEGLRWFEAILGLPSATPLTESRARTGAAVMCYTRGEFDRVRAELREAQALTTNVGPTDVDAVAELMRGHVERLAGNFTGARERFDDSLRTFELLASPWGVGYALSMMGWLALASGDEDEAQRLVDKAASALRGACPWFGTLALYVRAVIAVRHRNPDAAIAFVREGLALIRRVHDKFAFVHIMVPLAAAAILKGDGAWAARILGARDAVAERSGARVADGLAHELLGTIEREGRKGLGANRWVQAYESGRTASIDSLLNDIESASK